MNEYIPDVVSSPGETLREMLDEWMAQEVQMRCGLMPSHLQRLLDGDAPFTEHVIRCLADMFPKVSANFWREREKAYRAQRDVTLWEEL